MIKTTCCTIRLLNKSYEIKCPENEQESLLLAAEKLNEHLVKKKNGAKRPDDFNTLLLAALHLSHELITCQTQQKEQRQQLTQFINTLENKISKVGAEVKD